MHLLGCVPHQAETPSAKESSLLGCRRSVRIMALSSRCRLWNFESCTTRLTATQLAGLNLALQMEDIASHRTSSGYRDRSFLFLCIFQSRYFIRASDISRNSAANDVQKALVMEEENPELEDIPDDDANEQQHVEVQAGDDEAVSPISPVADGAATVEQPRPGGYDAASEKPRGAPNWLPASLSVWFMLFLIFWDLSMIVVLLALTVVSTTRNGISTIRRASIVLSLNSGASSPSSAYAILWTSVPPLIISIYNLTRGLSVTAIGVRQPYVTLWRKPMGAPARKTIFLDYQYQGGILGACLMRRNRHWHILVATVLTFLTSIAIVPLSSHVLEVRQTSFNSTVQVQYNSAFNETMLLTAFNVLGALDVASAVAVYQASPPPWMDQLRGYQPFTLPNTTNNGSVTVETIGYSAFLDCNIITPEEYTFDTSGQEPTFTFTDRGCATTRVLQNSNLAHFLFYSYSEESCGIEAQFSRIGLLAASYTNVSQLDPPTLRVVSCEPSYWQMNGSLTVSPNVVGELVVSSFHNSSPWDLARPSYWENVESEIVGYGVVDSSGYISGDELGRKVYNYALLRNPKNILDPDTLKGGLEAIFTAAYAGLFTSVLTPTPETFSPATLTTLVYRLFVVTAIAAIIMFFLLFNLLCNMWILIRSRRYSSILTEEPRGLLATTALAYDSQPDAQRPGIYSAIERFKARHPAESAVREKMEKAFDVDKMVCYFDRDTWTIRLRNFPGDDDAMITSANLAGRDHRGAGSP
jgi:hypothetical protein